MPKVPPHRFAQPECSAMLIAGPHEPYLVDGSDRIFCSRCGAEAVDLTPRVVTAPGRRAQAARRGSEMHVTPEDVVNGRIACEALVWFMGWGHAVLIDEHAGVPWRFTDRMHTPVALGKAITRSSAWGHYTDYAFSLGRWATLLAGRRNADLPVYLILTSSDGVRGYVEVDETAVAWVGPYGARGEDDRGDPHDDEEMVHIDWGTFTRIP